MNTRWSWSIFCNGRKQGFMINNSTREFKDFVVFIEAHSKSFTKKREAMAYMLSLGYYLQQENKA